MNGWISRLATFCLYRRPCNIVENFGHLPQKHLESVQKTIEGENRFFFFFFLLLLLLLQSNQAATVAGLMIEADKCN
jgi:hypothetical protein